VNDVILYRNYVTIFLPQVSIFDQTDFIID